jgi:hypothetical protein
MSKSALLEFYPDRRRKVVYHEEDGKTWIETSQDVDPIIQAARILADEPPGKDFRHVAFMPEEAMNQALVDGWFNDPKAIKKWVNDPANRDFRTWKGRI